MNILIQNIKFIKIDNLDLNILNDNFKIKSDQNIDFVKINKNLKLLYIGNIFFDKTKNYKSLKDLILFEFKKSKSKKYFINKIKNLLDGRYLMILIDEKKISGSLFVDKYGRFECFYHKKNNKFEIASNLSLFNTLPSSQGYDQLGLGHLLSNYSSRPAKKSTIYKNVHRLGVGEIINFKNNITSIEQIKFKALKTKNLKEEDLNKYSELFIKALKRYGSKHVNVVYLSSGWDSTSILAGLVHIYGSKKVKAVIGRMNNSKRSKVLNPFEIKKAKKIANYFKVSLNIVDFDYSKKIPKISEKLKNKMKSCCVYAGTMNNHGLLANYVKDNYDDKAAIFCGEISDGVHNLGFSQFTSIFHSSKNFREYSDKMMSYFYGPTFLKIFENNNQDTDQIYNLFKSLNKNLKFDNYKLKTREERRLKLLTSFFLTNKRLPLVSNTDDKIFTKKGKKIHYQNMKNIYLKEASKKIRSNTVYSWYIHLYNSFHWQGSTVSTLTLTSELFNQNMQMPFYDIKLQDFLSIMPENFGRGLDFNPTKYPLKWTLKNKIDYPFNLQAGPHAYVYDTNPSFNLAVETFNYSAFAPYFREILSKHPYRKILSKKIFNLKYIDNIVKKYVNGIEINGEELAVLRPLCFLFFIGIY